MIGIIGIVCVFVMVFGGYLAAGGKMYIILKALPYEMTMIGGAAVGARPVGHGARECWRIVVGADGGVRGGWTRCAKCEVPKIMMKQGEGDNKLWGSILQIMKK